MKLVTRRREGAKRDIIRAVALRPLAGERLAFEVQLPGHLLRVAHV